MSTASQGQVVAAYFDKQSDAENAIRDLQAAGFRSDQIGSSFDDYDNDPQDFDQLGHVGTTEDNRNLTSDNYSPNSATASTSTQHESFWDKVKDFFTGETADSDINDNPATDGAHTNVSARGGQSKWASSGIHIPNTYDERLSSGGGLVTVHTADRAAEAEQILTRNDGQIDRSISDEYGKHQLGSDQGSQAATPGMAYTNSSATTEAAGMGQGTRADITGGASQQNAGLGERDEDLGQYSSSANQASNAGWTRDREADSAYQRQPESTSDAERLREDSPQRRIQLVSEVLRVRKQRAERGEVRLRKTVRTETQNIQVPVTREEIVIERNPVQGERTATGEIGSDEEIRVPLSEERVEVEKVPVVTEEVSVGKRVVSNTQNVTDQVRREELDVDGADEELRTPSDPNRKIA